MVRQLPHIYEKINGFFTWPRLYKDMVDKFSSGSKFVEVGLFEGRSLSYLVIECHNSGKRLKVYGVDPFYGLSRFRTRLNLVLKFKKNTFLIHKKFTLITKSSIVAAQEFEDASLDFVFIDANHDYEYVKEDILAWLPKIKKGGVMAGHDYHLNTIDFPGVYKAVHEIFGNTVDKSYVKEFCWLVNL